MPYEGAVGIFGFGVRCRFRVFSFLASVFRFLAKIQVFFFLQSFSVSGNFLSGLSVFHRPQHLLIYNTSNKDDVTFRVVIVSRRTTMLSQIPHALSAQRHTTIKITMFSMRGSSSPLLIGSWRQLPMSRFGIVMQSIANQNLTNRFHVFVHLLRNRSQMVHLFACVLPVYMPISQRFHVRELRVWGWGGGGFALYWNSLYNRRLMSQARRTRHFARSARRGEGPLASSRASHSFRASPKIPRSPRLAH